MTEENLKDVVDVLVLIVEAIGAAIIFVGAGFAFLRFVSHIFSRRVAEITDTRLFLARFLALGLEFQLAADILRTAVSPTFEQIGKLAAIAAIRTALNFFLHQEIMREEQEVKESGARPARAEA
jgi:uncharacterized membrane protein